MIIDVLDIQKTRASGIRSNPASLSESVAGNSDRSVVPGAKFNLQPVVDNPPAQGTETVKRCAIARFREEEVEGEDDISVENQVPPAFLLPHICFSELL